MRRIFTYVLGVLIAAFLWIVFQAPTTHAADASWDGNVLVYDGNTYGGPAAENTVSALGFPDRTTVYTYDEPQDTSDRKIHILYYAPGIDAQLAETANYRTYTRDGPNSFSNPSEIEVVNVMIPASAGTTSCDIGHGAGWMICPITNFLADSMDWIFGVLAELLAVRPPQTSDQETALYRSWSYMRTIANIAFAIAFMIIIYSQLTNIGLTNYSLKKLIPRLIIAAVLVNISYLICSIAIDLSNILGYTVQDIFVSMRNTLVGTEGNTWDLMSFSSVTAAILAGGTLALVGIIGISNATMAAGVGAVAFLLPILVTGLISVIVALAVIAARQAIIVILTVLSPLAFVAYLLPNTEQWFTKWRSLFMTMLVLFPAFSVVFGGSQLAASIVIQNADSINIVLLAMFIQVAPLFITPLLVRLSGAIISRFAGVMNGQGGGIINKTKEFTKDRTDNMRARRAATEARPGFMGASQRALQRSEQRRRRREGFKAAYTNQADANWANSNDGIMIDQQNRRSADEKTLAESISAIRYNKSKLGDVELQELDVIVKNAKANLDNSNLEVEVQYKNLQSNASTHNIIPAHLATEAIAARQLALRNGELNRSSVASDGIRQDEFAEAMIGDTAMQQRAGGIDPLGSQTALANAVNTMRSSYNKNTEEARAINKHFNLSGSDRQNLSMGRTFTKTDSYGNSRTFSASDTFLREAAIEDQISQGTVLEAIEIIQASGAALSDFKTTISATMASSGFGSKTIWGGGKTIDLVGQGAIGSLDDLIRAAAESVAKGKTSTAQLTGADAEGLKIYSEMIKDLARSKSLITDPVLRSQFDDNFIQFSEAAKRAFTTDEYENLRENSAQELLKFAQVTDPEFKRP